MRKPKMMVKCQPKQMARNVYQLYIYDDISKEGKFDWSTWKRLESTTSAEYFRKTLAEIPEEATIELYMNSSGGEAIEGTAIYNQLVRHGAKKTGYVDGVAYSAAFLILMACDYIVMGLGTTAMCHNMWMTTSGNAEELRKSADDLDRLMESNRKIFLNRCNLDEEALKALMEEERILTPEECLELGFCDEISQQAAGIESQQEDGAKEEDAGEDDSEDEDTGEDGSGEEDSKEASTQMQFRTYFEQRNKVLKEINQLEQSLKKDSKPGSVPVQNKCISFFDQF